MYGFSEEFLLDDKTIEEVLSYYDDGIDFEFFKADILIGKIGEALMGKKVGRRFKTIGDKPDLKKFERRYGNKIVRPKR